LYKPILSVPGSSRQRRYYPWDSSGVFGESYDSYEYWDQKGDCWFSIRIGIGSNYEEKLRAKLTLACPTKTEASLDLKNCPALLSE
jgi:hypothetical protein